MVVPPSHIGAKSYDRLSPEGIGPQHVDDPIMWLKELLPCFGYALADRPLAKDYAQLGCIVHEGEGRHNALVSYAGLVWVKGMTPETLLATLRAVNAVQCQPPLPDEELLGIAHHFIEQRTPRTVPSDAPDRLHPLTDAGNAELFADLFADRLRFDHRRKRWLVWQGHWWANDNDGEHHRLAIAAVRERYQRALAIPDLDERAKVSKFAIQSENRQRLDALLSLAQAERALADVGDQWDIDPFLLGVGNGVVDLRSGVLRDGRQEDRITLLTDIPYQPTAVCPRWERFLAEIFEGDVPLIDYLHRAVGYSLTGDTSEQDIFACWGKGSNGKTALLNILGVLAGRYSWNAPFPTFEAESKYAIPNDVAAMAGVRLVTSSETSETTRLNEARLKSISGGDLVSARYLHGEWFSFRPVAKVWLAVNHRPRVTDDSDGFWRRLKLIPFLRKFGKDADPYLSNTLLAELPGILAWAIRGCLEWQTPGLGPPSQVVAATDQYREDSDPLNQFVEERCVVAEQAFVHAGALYLEYGNWCTEQRIFGSELLSATTFGRQMTDKFVKKKTNRGAVYFGVGLRGCGLCDGAATRARGGGAVTGWVTGFRHEACFFHVFSRSDRSLGENWKYPSNPSLPSPSGAISMTGWWLPRGGGGRFLHLRGAGTPMAANLTRPRKMAGGYPHGGERWLVREGTPAGGLSRRP